MDNFKKLKGGGEFYHFPSSINVPIWSVSNVDLVLNEISDKKLNDNEIMKIYYFINEKIKNYENSKS